MKKKSLLAFVLALLLNPVPSWAIGESSTSFNTYVPPHADANHYYSQLVITATGQGPGPNGETTVNVFDMPADFCIESNCDPFGLMQNGNDGVIAQSNSQYTFTSASAKFTADSIGHYIVVNKIVYLITAYSSATKVSIVAVSGTAATGSNLVWAQARAANVTAITGVTVNNSTSVSKTITAGAFHKDDVKRSYVFFNNAANKFYNINSISNENTATLSGNATVNNGTMYISRPPDIDDSFKAVKLKRGESFVVIMGASNPCITGTCTNLNSLSTQSALDAQGLRNFFGELSPTPAQSLALEAALTSNALKLVYDDDSDQVAQKTAQRDGDYFIIKSDSPITVHQANRTGYEHDYAVSDGKNSIGHNFYLFATPTSDNAARDIEIVAYSDDTYVTIYKIGKYTESKSTCESGNPACVCVGSNCKSAIAEADWNAREKITKTIDGVLIDHIELDAGQSLNVWNRTIAAQTTPTNFQNIGIGLLASGQSYYVESTKPVTVQYGALQRTINKDKTQKARDGGGMVPSSNGTSSGNLFYFTIPFGNDGSVNERELRISSFDEENTICLDAFDISSKKWVPRILNGATANNPCVTVGENERVDLTGKDSNALTQHDLFRLTCSVGKKIAVTEANWMETGSIGTSDMATFVSAQNSEDEFAKEVRFLAYMPPPGNGAYITNHNSSYSHIYIFAEKDNTTATIRPTDVTGTMPAKCQDEFPDDNKTLRRVTLKANGFYNFRMDSDCYNALNNVSQGVRPYLEIIADANVAVFASNHNDNWMNYTTSLLPATPDIKTSVEPALLSVSQKNNAIYHLDTAEVTIEARHLFPVNRSDNIDDAKITITVPDGLSVVQDSINIIGLSREPTSKITTNAGVSTITVGPFNHPPFVSIFIKFKVTAKDTYNNGNKVSPFVNNKPTEDSLVFFITESGTINGTLAAGYGSGVARIFRCNVGDPTYDPDGDGQCSGTGACHTVNGTKICAGADMCPYQFGSNFDEAGRCPAGYICDSWGNCYADSDYSKCSPTNLQGSCAVAAGQLDSGLTCINGSCKVISASDSCEGTGSYCASGMSCVNHVCVEINGGDACWQRDDGFGKCVSSYSCVMGACANKSANACTSAGGYCAHDLACNASGKCVEIPEASRCNDGHIFGDCPHREACLSTICVDIADSDRCEKGGTLCPGGQSCQNKKCVAIATASACDNNGTTCPHSMACLEGACYWLDTPAVCDKLYGICDFETLDKCDSGYGYCPNNMACTLTGCKAQVASQECGEPGGETCAHGYSCSSSGKCEEINDDDSCLYGGSICPQSYACLNGKCVDTAGKNCSDGGTLCPHQQSCINNKCQDIETAEACGKSGFDCPHSQTCLDGVCYTPADNERCGSAQGGTYCPHGQACELGVCVNVTVLDRCEYGGTYCQHGLSCQNGVCLDLATAEMCENGGNYCPHSLVCVDNNGVRTCEKKTNPELCENGGNYCQHNLTCIAKTCQEKDWDDICENGGTYCPHKESCINNKCVNLNESEACEKGGNYCPHGMACINKVCFQYEPDEFCAVTNQNGYCEHSQVCDHGECKNAEDIVYTCSCEHPDGICNQGFVCKCESAPNECNAQNCGCEEALVVCSEEHPEGVCSGGRVCIEGQCIYNCSEEHANGYCADGQECLEGSCGSRCSEENQNGYCPNGLGCVAGTCTRLCSMDVPQGYCPSDSTCISGSCEKLCSVEYPDGYCPTGTKCLNGSCKVPGIDDDTDTDQHDSDSDVDSKSDDDPAEDPDKPVDDPEGNPESGCNCRDGGSVGNGLPFLLLGLMHLMRRRKIC